MTLLVIIAIGILGTILAGYTAYRLRDTSVRRQRQTRRRVRTEDTAVAAPQPTPTPRRRSSPGGNGCLVWLVLIVVIVLGISAYSYWSSKATTPAVPIASDEITTVVARPGQPAEVVVRRGWQLQVWDRDHSKFSSRMIRRGEDRVWVFITKKGVESAEIKVRVYYAPRR